MAAKELGVVEQTLRNWVGGRQADGARRQAGDARAEGFTHCCGKTRKGKFMVLRITSAKRLRAKLRAVKDEPRRRMHRPIAEQGQYRRSVVAGHTRYFGVPNNGARCTSTPARVAG